MYKKFLELNDHKEILRFDSSNLRKANDFLNKYLGFSYNIMYTKFCGVITYFIIGRNIPYNLRLDPGSFILINPGKSLKVIDPYSFFLN